jgi:mannose-6-phosphate isomerase-like protein (cupin superfamily)
MQRVTDFETKRLPDQPDAIAPDGSEVRVLLALPGGGLAHYQLAAGQTSAAVTNTTLDEIWFFLSGQGQLWRKSADREEVVAVAAGVCLTIPLGTHFQFRALGDAPLTAVGVTLPPWPGETEARRVAGIWTPTVSGPEATQRVS